MRKSHSSLESGFLILPCESESHIYRLVWKGGTLLLWTAPWASYEEIPIATALLISWCTYRILSPVHPLGCFLCKTTLQQTSVGVHEPSPVLNTGERERWDTSPWGNVFFSNTRGNKSVHIESFLLFKRKVLQEKNQVAQSGRQLTHTGAHLLFLMMTWFTFK